MIGGRFKLTSVASLAAAGLFMGGVSAQAADLGGNCCADLEERVAELEATTARKGNRKVSLEVSGHVHEGIFLWDDGFDEGAYIATVNYSRSRFRFRGSAKINADWSAGFLIEVGVRQTGNSFGIDQGFDGAGNPNGPIDIRHQALYIKSNTLGTVWLGQTAFAIAGVEDICLGCTISSSAFANLGWGGFETRFSNGAVGPSWGNLGTGSTGPSNFYRDQVLRYISPTIAGFVFSIDTQLNEWRDDADAPHWSVALRYAGEFNSIRVAAGIGYTEDCGPLNALGGGFNGFCAPGMKFSGWGASLSFQHTPTGLFIAGSYGERDFDNLNAGTDHWSVVGGVGGKWNSLGKTTLWVRYADHYSDEFSVGALGFDSEVISAGINQKIDAAAMEIYVSYYNISGDYDNPAVLAVEDLNVVLFGTRIRF